MRLHEIIADKPGARKSRKRIGRGEGNGRGKTSGRGHKGQKARSGGSIPIGFEGGKIPLYRTLPRRGFNNARFTIRYEVVNLERLAKLDSDEIIDANLMIEYGLIRKNAKRVKVLGDGKVEKPIKIKADHFSTSAKKKIEEAGGQALLTKENQV